MKQKTKKKMTPKKLVKRGRQTVKAVKAGSVIWNDVIPWVLVAFAAVAYWMFSIPIPPFSYVSYQIRTALSTFINSFSS